MMYVLLPAIVASAYVGNVLGCLVLCETIPELSKAKKFVWQVPIINVSFIGYILFSPKMKNEELKALLLYLKMPCKNVLVTYIVAETVKEIAAEKKRSDSRQRSKNTAQRFLENSVEEYGRTIIGRVPYV